MSTSGKPRIGDTDITWHIVEVVKDAAALHGLGFLAVGLNTARLAAKYARLFQDVHVISYLEDQAKSQAG